MLHSTGLWRALVLAAAVAAAAAFIPASAQPDNAKPGEPTDAKARKLFDQASDWHRRGEESKAIDTYLEANRQDGGRCFECLQRAYTLAMGIEDFRTARTAVEEGLAGARDDAGRAIMHFRLGMAWQRQGVKDKKDKSFIESCAEFKTALALDPSLTATHFSYGVSLAHLHQDDGARAQFDAFLRQDKQLPNLHPRAQRFAEDVDLARARMAPDFSITTLDGRQISLDSLAGKVVLIDFWATWCGPCVEALPHLRKIVQEFQGQPFVALSVSIDENAATWKRFVAANSMNWLQYHDGDSGVSVAALFGVHQVPATFSVKADGVLEDQHLVGDEQIDDKLKKLIAQAAESQSRSPQTSSTSDP
jgi:thiol-disulfide isomerase/thioredoxin